MADSSQRNYGNRKNDQPVPDADDVHLKAYGEAIADFEGALKDAGYADMALMSVKQKYQEKIDRVAKELSE